MEVKIINLSITSVSTHRLVGKQEIANILQIDGKDIPGDLKPLLQQQVLPTEVIRPLDKYRGQARSLMLRYATRSDFFGWIISPEYESDLLDGLRSIKEKYLKTKEEILARYNDIVLDHLEMIRKSCEKEKFPKTNELIDVIEKSVPSLRHLEEQIDFKYLEPKTVQIETEDELSTVENSILLSSLHEVRQRAKAAKESITPRGKLSAIDEILVKSRGLGYLVPELKKLHYELKKVSDQIPRGVKSKEYTVNSMIVIEQVVDRLMNSRGLMAAIKNGTEVFPVSLKKVDDLLSKEAPPTPPVEVNQEESLFSW